MMSFASYCMLFVLLVFCPETDGASLTWNKPPPTQIVQAAADPVKRLSSRQLFEGTTNATLSWHFGLTELIFKSLLIFFEGISVARVSSSVIGIPPNYSNRFGLDWISNQKLVKLFIFNVTTEDNGTFSCRVSADSLDRFSEFAFRSDVQVDVVGPPSNIVTSTNQTITAPAELTLNCSADGKPKPKITWTRVSDNTVVTMPLTISRGKNEESFRCTADNGVGNPLTKDVIVNILFSPKVTLAEKFFVFQGKTASVICQVEGNPKPTVSWSHCDLPNVICDKQYLNISKVQTALANYTCTARNAVGIDSATTVLVIGGYNIYVRMSISGECSKKDSVWETLEKEFNRVFANTQSYTEVELIAASCGSLIFDVLLKFSTEVAEDETISTIQTAIVDGKLGNLSVNVLPIIGIPPVEHTSTTARTSTTPTSDGLEIRATLTIITSYEQAFKDLNSASSKEFVAKFEQEMDKVYMNMPEYIRAEVTQMRPGSVIVYFILYFKTAVTPEKGIENLRIAISSNGTFGGFQVKDLVLMSEESTKSTETTGPSSSSIAASKAGPSWIIIIAVAGGVVLLAILVGVLTWRVHKQRKCRKDTKSHNSNLGRDDDEGGYSQVQGAYAQSGPPAANGTDGAVGQEIEVAAAIPNYAVVDKSKKKKKKKLREEVPPVYAEVDKSKKKKKKVEDKNLYETLDEPKEVRKPGELLYADLGDFQNPGMSPVSISPQPLPAIKIPEPYERTDYADITQFHKGNAKLPQNDGNEDTEMKPKRPSKKKIQRNDNETGI